MGSLTSRPKVPAPQPQVVFVPAPNPPSSAQTKTPDTKSPQGETDPRQEQTAEEKTAEIREENLLSRERGRFGTINTSLRGLLGLAGQENGGRKTLLGE